VTEGLDEGNVVLVQTKNFKASGSSGGMRMGGIPGMGGGRR